MRKYVKHPNRSLKFLIGFAMIGLALASCAPQQPILVYITPTPDTPTDTPTEIPTLEPLPTDTPGIPGTPTSTPLMIGAVVGADYTLQPSNTPVPTRTPEATVPPRPTATETPLPGPSPTPVPLLDASQMGVQVYNNYGPADWDQYLSRVQETGVQWIKVQANWAFLQPNGPNPNEEVLRTFELNLQSADRLGFNIIISVAKAPAWARPSGGADSPPDDPQALVDFLNMLFTETKIGEVVDAIEIWNEPNLRREWQTDALPFSGAGYMRLFEPAYNAIKAYRSDITVITAGLAPTGTSDFTVDDRVYLQQMYDAGLGRFTDIAIGAHPYGWGNPPDARCCNPSPDRGWDDNPHFFFLENLDATREIMNRNGHGNVPIWVTEFGWASWDDMEVELPDPPENNLWMTYNTLDQQAAYTLRAFEIAQSRGDVPVMILWNLNFANEFTVANREEIIAYSLLFPDEDGQLRRRPLFYLLALATGR